MFVGGCLGGLLGLCEGRDGMSAVLPDLREFDPLADKSYQRTRLGAPLVDYLAAKTVSGRADKTLRDKEVYIGSFAMMWPGLEIGQIAPRHIVHWLAAQKCAPESLRVRRSHLNDFLEWACVWDLIDRNPLNKLEQAKRAPKKTYDVFSDAERTALCSLPLIDGALMRVMFDAGLRRSECGKLRPRDIHPEPKPGQLVILDGKGGRSRLVPMTTALAQSLAILRSESGMKDTEYFWYVKRSQGRTIQRVRPIGHGSFQRWWTRSIGDAGVRYRNPHMTRHTFATRWLRRGGRLETLSLVMGHSSLAITYDLYGHLDTRDVVLDIAAMDALEE